MSMTKVDAIEKVMIDNGGSATLQVIYDNIEKYYPTAKVSKDWSAGIRGVLYRELAQGKRFKKIGLSIYAVTDYQEEAKPERSDKVRMHSFIEGFGGSYVFSSAIVFYIFIFNFLIYY